MFMSVTVWSWRGRYSLCLLLETFSHLANLSLSQWNIFSPLFLKRGTDFHLNILFSFTTLTYCEHKTQSCQGFWRRLPCGIYFAQLSGIEQNRVCLHLFSTPEKLVSYHLLHSSSKVISCFWGLLLKFFSLDKKKTT